MSNCFTQNIDCCSDYLSRKKYQLIACPAFTIGPSGITGITNVNGITGVTGSYFCYEQIGSSCGPCGDYLDCPQGSGMQPCQYKQTKPRFPSCSNSRYQNPYQNPYQNHYPAPYPMPVPTPYPMPVPNPCPPNPCFSKPCPPNPCNKPCPSPCGKPFRKPCRYSSDSDSDCEFPMYVNPYKYYRKSKCQYNF